MKLKLVKLDKSYRGHLEDMMDEWITSDDMHHPSVIFRNDYHDFEHYMDSLEVKEATDKLVPDSVFFCLDEERDLFVGAINIRHRLNDFLLLGGGHIGDGIRPSERRKGFATEMIRLALIECKELGIDRVLMTCRKDNIASSRTIEKNGGVLENEIEIDGVPFQRYWIELR
jgi:predicted acetyltransferase